MLRFERRLQRFTPVDDAARADKGKLLASLAALWSAAPTADKEEDADDA